MPTPETVGDYNRTGGSEISREDVGSERKSTELASEQAKSVARAWLLYLVLGAVLFAVLLPFDGSISRAARAVHLGGDVRREVEALQQFGQLTFSVLVALTIWMVDPKGRRRLADWGAAFLVTAVIVVLMKGLVGRPRPLYDDPLCFLGPLGEYPVSAAAGVRHAWEFWAGISSNLWSMPSSHTAYAAVMGAFVAMTYPRVRFLMFGLVAFVGVARVVTGGHYPTDVVVGGAIGAAVTQTAVARGWGRRWIGERAE
jgi:membrane-associated phospholipid phosphatase